jgi:DNA repair protein RecO (recombination protein O)
VPGGSGFRTYRTDGIVARLHDLGEADRIVTVVTSDRGIVRAVAKGARRPKSKIGGHLDLLRHVSLSVHEGRNLDTVSQAETIDGFRTLRGDLSMLSHGAYLAEVAERFSVEGSSNPALFRLLLTGLQALEEGGAPSMLARWFEVKLLQLSGFMPEIRKCVECGKELPQTDHVFSSERGGVVCDDCRSSGGGDVLVPAPVPAIKLLRHMARSEWDAVALIVIEREDARNVERILRDHIHRVLDRTVKSEAFMDEVGGWRA